MSLDPSATVRRRDLNVPREPATPLGPKPKRALSRPRPDLRAGLVRLRAGAGGAWRAVSDLLRRWFTPIADFLAPAVRRAGLILSAVTPLGWMIVGFAAVWWLAALVSGWVELAVGAVVLSVVFALSCLFTIGRTQLEVSLEIDPLRVVAGGTVAGRIQLTNVARTPLLPVALECPVGHSVARYTLPMLAAGAEHEEVMVIPTAKRGVIDIGPVTTMRGDPFGLVRREVTWADPVELFVHPRTIPLEPVGSGLLRDLEGRTTNDMSMSDLAFHTLREYVPGDDRRYIHWRSSAKASSTAGAGRFLVRQFLDTRRSHIAVLADVDPDAYASGDEFELAISVAASVALRTLADDMDLSILCGEHAATQPPPYLALDTYSRATQSPLRLPEATGMLTRLAPDASVAVLVTGSRTGLPALLHSRSLLPPEVSTFAIIVDPEARVGLRQLSGLLVLTVATLADLPLVLRGGQIQ